MDSRQAIGLITLGFAALLSQSRSYAANPAILDAAKAELTHSLNELKKQEVPPYFLSYQIIETHTASVSGSFGTLAHSGENRRRQLHIDLRVGDYALDNTRQVRGHMQNPADRFSSIPMPIEDDAQAIRNVLWYQTDKKYKKALEDLTTVRTNAQVKVQQEDPSGDFSREPAAQYVENAPPPAINRKVWEEKVRKYTAPFQRFGNLYQALATMSANQETRWFVSSDGSAVQTSQTYYRLQIAAFSKADDGMELPRFESYFSFTPAGLPDDAAVLKAVDKMIADLQALRQAPLVDPFTGPAILSGRATAVFFHEVFGHRIEGHRQKIETEGQTFRKMVGQPILPDFLSVAFDPTLRRYAGTDLVGSYSYDDEGVKARRVNAVDGGVLKNFLMSRAPIDGYPDSNGHGRAQAGFTPVARQSNLVVLNSRPISRAQLKNLLLGEIKKQDKPFGLLFDEIEGGFTITGRTIPNAFNVLPIMVYRIYPDGREELVRGVDLIGTPLTVFSKILAADDEASVFNGICGAESGSVPVSASAPAILVSQIEVQKKQKSLERSPILPAPFEDTSSAASSRDDVVMQAMRDEMQRSIQKLHLEKLDRPYFISYRVVDSESREISATLASLLANSENRSRLLTVNVRVGDYAFDNSNFLSLGAGGAGFAAQLLGGVATLPLDDNYGELRRQIWLATDGAYKKALEDMSGKRAALQNKNREDQTPDFTRVTPVSIVDMPPRVDLNGQDAVRLVRDASAVFREAPSIQASLVHFSAENRLERYLDSEGGTFTRLVPRVSLRATASTQAPDGMPLGDFVSAYGYTVKDLPSADELQSRIHALESQLSKLQAAPIEERYNGPVLFEGQAAAEVFARNFAEALPAQPSIVSNNAQLDDALRQQPSGLLNKLGARVLPEFINVVDDPTAGREKDSPLFGGYKVDEEGVPAKRTVVVQGGILKTVLTSRAPVRGVPESTGNLRERGIAATNLFVNADQTLTSEELHKRLTESAMKRGNRFGIVVRRLSGKSATLAYRLYPDGHEELIRNAELSGMSPASFKDIVAVSDQKFVYTEATPQRTAALFMTAQLTAAPLESYVVPSLLFDDLTIQKIPGNSSKPPIASNPLPGK